MFGKWDVHIEVGMMPQEIATAFAELGEKLVGAQYESIAYLGRQEVNGTNHAVLAKQRVITGVDSENVVVMVFNEKPEGVTLVSIERVLEGGLPMGGTRIDIHDPEMHILDDAFSGFVGSRVEPKLQLGTKMEKGETYFFLAELETVAMEPDRKAMIVSVNPMTRSVGFNDILASKGDAALGYAFTWLR